MSSFDFRAKGYDLLGEIVFYFIIYVLMKKDEKKPTAKVFPKTIAAGNVKGFVEALSNLKSEAEIRAALKKNAKLLGKGTVATIEGLLNKGAFGRVGKPSEGVWTFTVEHEADKNVKVNLMGSTKPSEFIISTAK